MRRRQQRRVPLPHYSEAAKGEFVWGMHNVYHDNLVNNEVLKFNVSYKELIVSALRAVMVTA